MKLFNLRTDFTSLSTVGELSVDGQFFGFTLEPPKREQKPCCIPEGTYEVDIRWSPKHHGLIPHVENVPGFEEIEIHIGNFPHDTEGCLLVGTTKGANPDFIGGSKVALTKLFVLLGQAKVRGEAITITYGHKASQGLQDNLRKLGRSEEEIQSGTVNVPETEAK